MNDQRFRRDGTPQPAAEGIELAITSIVSAATNRAMVDITIGPTRIQVEPDKARAIGHWLLECAEASEHDESFIRFSSSMLKLDRDQAIRMLQEMRKFRKLRSARERETDTSTAGPHPSDTPDTSEETPEGSPP